MIHVYTHQCIVVGKGYASLPYCCMELSFVFVSHNSMCLRGGFSGSPKIQTILTPDKNYRIIYMVGSFRTGYKTLRDIEKILLLYLTL